MAGHDIRDGLAAALVRNMDGLHSHRILEHLEIEMRDAADTGGAVIHFLRNSPRVRDELGDCVDGDFVCNDQGRRRCRNRGDRLVLRQRIEARCGFLIESLADAKRILREQERVAIRLGARHVVPSEIAVRARAIFHDHRLAKRLLEIIRDLPGKSVGRSARHEGHDQAHRA